MPLTKIAPHFFQPAIQGQFLNNLLLFNKPTLNAIYKHPFNRQLLDGTLRESKFGQYLEDDYFYLSQFANSIRVLATRVSSTHSLLAEQLNDLGTGIIGNEQRQHRKYLKSTLTYQPGPTIKNYVDYLKKTTAQSEINIAVTSILPCFWVYHEIGIRAKSVVQTNNPYHWWIATYSGLRFTQTTKELASTVNTLGNKAHPELRQEMAFAFTRALTFEKGFFDEMIPPKLATASYTKTRRPGHKPF